MTRALQLSIALLCCLAAATARPAHAVTVQQEAGGLRVRTTACSALVDPANGGRITSLVVDGAEMTHLCPDGHGGLFEETRSADLPYEVLRQESDGPRLVLALAARVGALRIVKEFTFSDGQPTFTVRLTYENAAPFALSGADAPALRHLVLPAGGQATGRELYCTARTRGAEVLSADILLARTYAAGPARALRWMAVSEPAGRRALGFALAQGGSRPLPPLRAKGGGLLTGWSVPPVPAAGSLTVSVLVVPMSGFTAVAELNAHFGADAVLDASSPSPVIHLNLLPLENLPELSIITRTYDADGRELQPCDPLLLDRLEPFKARQGDVACAPGAPRPAWFVHEVYSGGRKISTFAVPLGQPAGPSPSAPERLPDAVAAALPGVPGPAARIPLTPERRRRGFLLWLMDGPPATDEAQDLSLALTTGERTTVFLGLHALQPIASMRLSLAPTAEDGAAAPAGAAPVPPSAIYLWRVVQDAAGLARLESLDSAPMKAGETAWLALTADSSRLGPGRYAGRLVAEADGGSRELPLQVQVIAAPGGTAGRFGLWYLGADDAAPMDGPALQKLTDYGVRALSLPVDETTAAAVRSGLPDPQLSHMHMLAFAGLGGVLPPAGPAPGALPLPYPDPLWMLRANASTAAAVRAAAQAGYSPALLCERLSAVGQDFFDAAGKGARPVWLVEGGLEPDALPGALTAGAMDARTPVWLYLDLRGVDWRAAALQVRSAVWAAAWQGLAGLAVTCDPPATEVDRQLAIWHVLHDACGEASLWRQADRAGAGAGVVGPEAGSLLVLKMERAPFRRLYRVAPAGAEGVRLEQFAEARLRTVALAAQLGPAQPAPGPGGLYWRGMPLLDAGRVRWAVFAPSGQDRPQRAALSFQQALTKLAGRPVPLVHAWPQAGPDAPALVWAFADEASWPALPDAVRAALDKRAGAAFLTADLEDGMTVASVRPDLDTKTLLDALLPVPDLYPTAGGVR